MNLQPKQRAATEERAFSILAGKQASVRQESQNQFRQAYTLVRGGAGLADPRVVTLMATMEPSMQEQLRSFTAKDGVIHTDPVALNSLRSLAASNPESFLATIRAGDAQLLTAFAPSDYQQVKGWEKEIEQKGQLGDAPGIMTKQQIFDEALVNAGLYKTVNGNTIILRNDPQAFAMRREVEGYVSMEEKAKGRALTPKEYQTILDESVIHNTLQPAGMISGYKSPVQLFKLTEEQRAKASRDLTAFEAVHPLEASQARDLIGKGAENLGLNPSTLSQDQYNRAFAQLTIFRERTALDDPQGAAAAKKRMQEVLKETPVAPGPSLGRTAASALGFGLGLPFVSGGE